MTFFVGVLIEGLILLPSTIGLYTLTDSSIIPFGVGFDAILSFFILRHRNKDTRNRRLSACQQYEKEHPARSRFLFFMVIIIPILLLIAAFVVGNIRYNIQ